MHITYEGINYDSLTLIILLLAIGVFSLVERILLACVQHRHGPSSVVLNGLSMLLADGVKLYSKGQIDIILSGIGLVTLGAGIVALSGLYLIIKTDGIGAVGATELELTIMIAIGTFIGALLLIPASTSSSKWSALGSVRQIRALILSDLALDFTILVLVGLCGSLSASSDHIASSNSSLSLPLVGLGLTLAPVMLATTRVPFDLPEAESELIAGPLTELAGVAFSLILISDYVEFVLWLHWIGAIWWTMLVMSCGVFLLALTCYLGRLFMLRFMPGDVARMLFHYLFWGLAIPLLTHGWAEYC